MWRYSFSFFLSGFLLTLAWRLVISTSNTWEELGIILGALLLLFWIGDCVFLRGFLPDRDVNLALRKLLIMRPAFATRLIMLGTISGVLSSTLTILAVSIFQSILPLMIPLLVFAVSLEYLRRIIKRDSMDSSLETE